MANQARQELGLSALVFEQSPDSLADRLSAARTGLSERRFVKLAPSARTSRSYRRRPQRRTANRAGDDKNSGGSGQHAERRGRRRPRRYGSERMARSQWVG